MSDNGPLVGRARISNCTCRVGRGEGESAYFHCVIIVTFVIIIAVAVVIVGVTLSSIGAVGLEETRMSGHI